LIVLLVPMLATPGVLTPEVTANSKIQPQLLELVAQHPDQRVSVIIQKTSKESDVESNVRQLGGVVSKDLHIINAFVANIQASSVPKLASNPSVRWVSLNSLVNSTTVNTFTTWATAQGTTVSGANSSSFNNTAIAAGRYIWFNSILTVSGLGSAPVTIDFDNTSITFTANGTNYLLSVPNASVTFDPAATTATTTFNATDNKWVTRVRSGQGGDIFLSGLAYQVPTALPGGMNPVTWTGRFTTSTPGVSVSWKWRAAVYSTFSASYAALGIKPIDSSTGSQYANSDKTGTPENFKPSVVGGARGNGGTNYTGDQTGGQSVDPFVPFVSDANMVDSGLGANGTYGYGTSAKEAFTGFSAERTPGNAISRVELAIAGYVPSLLPSGDDPVITPYVGGVAGRATTLSHHAFDANVGISNTGTIYLDITASRIWRWGDFDNELEIVIDHGSFHSTSRIYYDAVGLRVTSALGTDPSGGRGPTSLPRGPVDHGRLTNIYNRAVRATDVWNEAPLYLQGQGLTVAVVDSGVMKNKDIEKRVIANASFDDTVHGSEDAYGHGTFVAGVVAGDGKDSNGTYIGVAPKTNIVNARIANDQNSTTEADVVGALQWINDNRTLYNIRVVNLSINATTAQSYMTSPIDAACEILWFNGIVVVVAAGNNGTGTLYPPANDPFVITVGAVNDMGTTSISDDTMAPFSAYGTDETGGAKPDLVAPGVRVVAPLPDNERLTMSRGRPANRINSKYFRLSGTSISTPIVSGAVALLLQDEPNLTPDQVKYRLKATAVGTNSWAGYNPTTAGAGYLNIYAAVHGNTTQSANTGITASQLLWTGSQPVNWGSVNWGSVNWGSVNWGSVNWGNVNWGSVNWGTIDWNN
jgi:serine protease AprX